jgi:hypothetical protein
MRLKQVFLLATAVVCAATLATATQAQNFKPTGPALPIEAMAKDWAKTYCRCCRHARAKPGHPRVVY